MTQSLSSPPTVESRGSKPHPESRRSESPHSESPVPDSTVTPTGSAGAIARLESQVGRVVRGKSEVVRVAVVSLLARGHILIEDVPGVGKTTLAQALARSLGLSFQRVQFTSDLLPSDILGVSVFDQTKREFQFVPGPIFAHVVVADEINRASPKTQSALLEAMSERHVTIDGEHRALPNPFVVLATQNPLEHAGTFPLPESQLDRFLVSLRLGYPPRAEERGLLMSGGVEELVAELDSVVGLEELLELQRMARAVTVSEKLVEYMLDIVETTRRSGDFHLGVSTRGAQGLYRAVQALALCEGRDFALPDDVQRLAASVLAHRVVLKHGSGDLEAARATIDALVHSTAVPV